MGERRFLRASASVVVCLMLLPLGCSRSETQAAEIAKPADPPEPVVSHTQADAEAITARSSSRPTRGR